MAKRKPKILDPTAIDGSHLRSDMPQDDPLKGFIPEVADWFRESVGTPTDAQVKGWPSIQSGQHTLIVAPTGSGKTLAAFLAGLDTLWRTSDRPEGVQILYLSPLKALNQDIERNLDRPLAGVSALAAQRGLKLPLIRTAVRTGDTPTSQRQAQARKPPDVLITTPESLHLILGSKARSMLNPVRWVIIDELHALAGQKRGTFLAILLERLSQELGRDPVRIGLTATVHPLDIAARFLGGFQPVKDSDKKNSNAKSPRPVNIVRAVMPKSWNLLVKRASVEMDPQQPRTIWPNLEKELVSLIADHNSTLVFANNRYLVERLTARINEYVESSQTKSPEPDRLESTVGEEQPEPSSEAWVHAHHGSISLERRRLTESALKEGRLKGVISTASLEMGIDMGAVDLVCQIGSPGEVARGLQRVGRAGHSVGDISKGRFFAKTTADLLETAALVEAMGRAAVEPLAIPQNCLDMLAQQVVACVAVRPWAPRELLQMFRQSFPYQDLPESAFEAVLEMLSGRFRVEAIRDLKARIYWDRVKDQLVALPGSSSLALMGGGAIPDTGQYPVKLGEGGPTLGSLDEEFVLERRPGEAFRLGSSTWRIDRIEADRVVVSPSGGGDMVVMPFWRGEESRRSATLGAAIGGLIRRVGDRDKHSDISVYLRDQCRLDDDSAGDLIRFIDRQKRVAGSLPDDRTILVEAFRDPAGEVALAILSPWGGRVHQALKLILQNRLFDRFGFRPAAQHADDGLIMRLPRDVENQPPLDLLDQLSFGEASERLRLELADSALFGLRFRQNASRALLLPRPDPGKRTPLWLQRLRAKDLLQVVRQMPDFPIVLECYRECLTQDLDLDLLRNLLEQIEAGSIRIVKRSGETASPFAADLMNRFERKFLYEWDEPHQAKGGRGRANLAEPPPGAVLDELLDPRAVERLGQRLADAWKRPVRSAEELAERIERLGDLSSHEVIPELQPFLDQLADRKICIYLNAHSAKHGLWIAAEEQANYQAAFPYLFSNSKKESKKAAVTDMSEARWAALDKICTRFVRTRSLITVDDLVHRYSLEPSVAADWLAKWTESGGFVRIPPNEQNSGVSQWADARHMRRMVEMSLSQRRRDVQSISPESWAAWVAYRAFGTEMAHQKLQGNAGLEALSKILMPLQGWSATPREWREAILPKRLSGHHFQNLDAMMRLGDWSWTAIHQAEDPPEVPRIAFQHRDFPGFILNTSNGLGDEKDCVGEIRDLLIKTGPATSAEIALKLAKPISNIRNQMKELVRSQSVTNEKVVFLERFFSSESQTKSGSRKTGGERQISRPPKRIDGFRALLAQQGVGGGQRGLGRNALTQEAATEGRWRWLSNADDDVTSDRDESETRMAAWAALLMQRYGVVCREVVHFAAPGLTWAELADWLESAEWRGEVRRGYFVEGLSGVQYTTDDTANELVMFCDRIATGAEQTGLDPSIHLVSAIDPANVYGSSAPLDLPLIEGGRARLPRILSNSLVLVDGRPVWIVQERGKRLTSLPHASEAVREQALRHLIRNFTGTSTKWTVTVLDDAPPVTTKWAEVLGQLGFVHDGLSMTMYRGLS